MGRPIRHIRSDAIYHVFNRAAGRRRLFDSDEQYSGFARILREAQTRVPIRILAYCLMPNHWHLVIWLFDASSLPRFMHRVTHRQAREHNIERDMAGHGHVYGERYKCVLVKDDRHLLTVLRYVEANPRVAGLVRRAEEWPWSSAYALRLVKDGPNIDTSPVPRPADWLAFLNRDLTPAETDEWSYGTEVDATEM
jgi:putative transposase